MKKVYLSLLAIGIASTSLAQMTAKPLAFGQLNTGKDVINAPALNNATQAKALGIEIWSDNFDTPSDWVIDNSGQAGGAFGWTIDATYDGWSTVGGPLSSTSGGNYAELSNGNAVNGDQALDVTYTLTLANAIDIVNLPLNTPMTDQVNLQYEQTGALFNDEQFTHISVAGGTPWVTFRDNRDFHDVLSQSGGSAYPNPETVSINLAPYIAGNANNFSIRFQWTTAFPGSATNPNVWVTYGWTLDDLKLITNPDNDISAQTPYWGSVGLNYYQIPTAQVAPIDFTTNAFNNGLATQNNVTLNVDVNSGAWTGSSAAGVSIAAGSYDSLVCTTQYTPAATVGTHNVVWGVTQDEVDDVPGNNDNANINFEVTQYVYARDNGTVDGSTYNQGNGYEVGNLFDVFTAAELTRINVGISSSSVIGANVFAKLYSIDPTTGDFLLEDQTDYYALTAGDLGSTLNLPLLQGNFTLTAGETYLVVAGSDGDGGATDDVVIANAGSSDPQTSFFYDYTDLMWYYTTNTPVVQMDFTPLSIDENDLFTNVVVYPNPANEELNIDFSLENATDISIEILDLAGKTVATKAMENAAKGTQTVGFNTADFASGVYTVTIESANGKLTRKFIKK
jgi:hypothetical protein